MYGQLMIWLIGWIILSIIYFIANIDKYESKKLLTYKSFLYGALSWIGIIFCIAFAIVGLLMSLDEYIENKLK